MIGGIVGLGASRPGGSDCAMSFSNTFPELDEKGTEWCGDNLQKLEAVGVLN
jgi:predicted Zn-dependent protease